MKKLSITAIVGLLLSLQAFALEYTCESYSMRSQNPTSDPVTLNFVIELDNEYVEITSPELNFSEVGTAVKLGSSNVTYKLIFGIGADQVQFMIPEDNNTDVLGGYVNSVAQNHSLNARETEQLDAKIRGMFSGININATQLVLAQVSDLMSCKRL